jgi:enoyl-CoA hydratase/carnithine racemase
MYENIIYEKKDGIGRVTINRPKVLNALNEATRAELGDVWDKIDADPEVKVVILTGAGRAFSSGADLKNLEGRPHTVEGWRDRLEPQLKKLMKVWSLRQPVIAAVRGYALGEGCDYALVADITIAAEGTKFGWPEVRQPGMSFLFLAPYVMGMKLARQYLYTGDFIEAEEAYRIGMINKVVPLDKLDDEAQAMAERFTKITPEGPRWNKRSVNRAYEAMGIVAAWWYNFELSIVSTAKAEEGREERDRLIKEKGIKAFFEQRDKGL